MLGRWAICARVLLGFGLDRFVGLFLLDVLGFIVGVGSWVAGVFVVGVCVRFC